MSSDSDNSDLEDENEFLEQSNAVVFGEFSVDFLYINDKSDNGYVINSTVKFLNETKSLYEQFETYENFIEEYPHFRLRSEDCDEIFNDKINVIMNRKFQGKPIPFYSAYLIASMLNEKITRGVQYADVMERILAQFC